MLKKPLEVGHPLMRQYQIEDCCGDPGSNDVAPGGVETWTELPQPPQSNVMNYDRIPSEGWEYDVRFPSYAVNTIG